mgnify:CR=1 FL=1
MRPRIPRISGNVSTSTAGRTADPLDPPGERHQKVGYKTLRRLVNERPRLRVELVPRLAHRNTGVRMHLFQVDLASAMPRQITRGDHALVPQSWGTAAADRHIFMIDEPTRIGDLMAALEASVAAAREARRSGGEAEEEGAWQYRRRARLAVRDVVAKGRVLVGFKERRAALVNGRGFACHGEQPVPQVVGVQHVVQTLFEQD